MTTMMNAPAAETGALSPEEMLRVAAQLRSWVRGVPPPYACLTARDKRWLTKPLKDYVFKR